MVSIIYTIILIVFFIILVRKKKDAESYFPLKVFGYLILGSFALNLNHISLPLGFVLYLLFLRPKLNRHVKSIAVIYGVVTFVLFHWILPVAIQVWENRPHYFEHEINSIYTVDFQEEYELIKEKLKLDNNGLKLEDFEVNYVKNGSITKLSWQTLLLKKNRYTLYRIDYDVENNRYRVTESQLDTWFQYDRLIEADRFFENLNMLDSKGITQDKGQYPYYVIRSSGERVTYEESNGSLFVVENGKIQSVKKEQLPIEGYGITTFAMKKTGEQRNKQGNITQQSFEGTNSSVYLFNIIVAE